jgi:hypothetical protein
MPTMKKTYQTPKTFTVELQHQMHLLGASGEGLEISGYSQKSGGGFSQSAQEPEYQP